MKNVIRRIFIPIVLSAAILPVTSVFATPIEWYQQFNGRINGIEVTRNDPPKNLLLREQTPVYANPGDAKPIGALAPQIVDGIEARENTADADKWYYVDTWLGKAWVHPHSAIANYSNVEGHGQTARVVDFTKQYGNSNTALYADAFGDKRISWAWLAPQEDIEVVAYGNGMTQIKTWIGLIWIMPQPSPPKV